MRGRRRVGAFVGLPDGLRCGPPPPRALRGLRCRVNAREQADSMLLPRGTVLTTVHAVGLPRPRGLRVPDPHRQRVNHSDPNVPPFASRFFAQRARNTRGRWAWVSQRFVVARLPLALVVGRPRPCAGWRPGVRDPVGAGALSLASALTLASRRRIGTFLLRHETARRGGPRQSR